jgi:hypothetical protein
MPRPPQQSFTCSPSRPPSTAAAISPAICPGSGFLPADSVRELSTTATLTPLTIPTGAPDPRYRPTARTAEFVRWRDLTCRWPGCDAPVERCDIDHTVPYPAGATHPSDLKHYCRTHHLTNTLYRPPGGWPDIQSPCSARIFSTDPSRLWPSAAYRDDHACGHGSRNGPVYGVNDRAGFESGAAAVTPRGFCT